MLKNRIMKSPAPAGGGPLKLQAVSTRRECGGPRRPWEHHITKCRQKPRNAHGSSDTEAPLND